MVRKRKKTNRKKKKIFDLDQTDYCMTLDEHFNQILKFLPDDLTLIFVPIHSLIIPVDDDDNNKIDKQTQDIRHPL